MPTPNIKRALISVYDKTGVVDFAKALVDKFGIEIISTGGTAKLLRESDIPVTPVEKVTGFPEMMDGRVKTLHPKIHAAILADRDNAEHMRQLNEQGIEPIDMVVVSLYPFEETVNKPDCTFEQAIEMIDIGGPCMLRAAAKNHRSVVPICHYEQFQPCLDVLSASGDIDAKQRLDLARAVFFETTVYDSTVTEYFYDVLECDEPSNEECDTPALPPDMEWDAALRQELRYGENPHQSGGLYEPVCEACQGDADTANLVASPPLQGEMSFNNYGDSGAALDICRELSGGLQSGAACVFVKHANACGVGIDTDPLEAYARAYLGDPSAAMGGILACSFPVSVEFAAAAMETYQRWGKEAGAGGFFIEVWIAPEFEPEAISAINQMKKWGERVRLIPVRDMLSAPNPQELDFKKIAGGMLVQDRDLVGLNEEQWKVVTKKAPTESQMSDLRIAWLICKHTKSNAITVCKDGMLIGNGAGQMSRVMSCRIATWLAGENGHQNKLKGAVAASDAFFPFRDGPDILMDAGVQAIIQPGGSKRDENTIEACNERGVAMIFTGTRHFKH